MDFGKALDVLRAGRRVGRSGWNGSGMWIALSPGFSIGPDRIFSEAVKEHVAAMNRNGVFRPYLIMKTVDGEFVPWVASQSDILSWDWEEVP